MHHASKGALHTIQISHKIQISHANSVIIRMYDLV